ncbi:MAG TPA: chemotaxis protein CheA [Azospirillum sp.]|nr:chemotaxis protein CheA [Azospirillum sp.]
MSELFDQFLIESRELLDSVGSGLLLLEKNLDDKAAVNELFRAFHTLKGATALFDWPAFTHLVHAAEDLLSVVRSGDVAATPDLIDRLFAVADQSSRWVDHIEAHQELPADAGEHARRLEERLRAAPETAAVSGTALPDAFAWLTDLTREEREALRGAGGTLTAVAYDPDPECFFNGDDPLALCRRIPHLVLLRIETASPLPDLTSLDPYRCLLRFRAISAAPQGDVVPVFRTAPDQVRFAPVPPDLAGAPQPAIPKPAPVAGAAEMAEEILREQRRILALDAAPEELEGRLASVARSAANVLTALGRDGDVAALQAAAASARAVRRPGPLANHLATLLASVATEATEAKLAEPEGRAARRALRIEPERVDRLLALVGELTVAKNRLPSLARMAEADRVLARTLREVSDTIDRLSDELQNAVLRLRMLPLAMTLQPLPRLVRDLSQRLAKRVELHVTGERTEADKDVLDVLGEPLIHLVRNAVDHGIETPERRLAAGKPEAGTIRIDAHQDKDSVVIEVADDGAGIDAGAVRRKAVESGVIDAARAAHMSDAEALSLVFLPGVSTARAVTDLSGRGVGMDAVRTAVEQAGGRIEIASEPGRGTCVRLILPLTMVITPVMVVEAADGLFGIPTGAVAEVAKVPSTDIRRVKHAESVVLRDQLIPVFRLRRLLGLPDGGGGEAQATVLVLRLGREPVGLVVDAIRERLDAVLKPLSGVLATLRGYAGTAELGDGRLLPVINLRELL